VRDNVLDGKAFDGSSARCLTEVLPLFSIAGKLDTVASHTIDIAWFREITVFSMRDYFWNTANV
jgi:hypothetical protein